MDSVLKDLGFAVRTLKKNPGFTAVAILTIALGIGACTAVFSVVNGVLLRPLPYGNPERVVLIWSELRTRNVLDFPFSIPDLRDFRHSTQAFEQVAAMSGGGGRVAVSLDGTEPEQVRSGAATANLFKALGVTPIVGRDFTDEDGAPQPQPPPQPPGVQAPPPGPPPLPPVVMLSHRLWQRKFGGDPSIAGKMIALGNGRALVAGVLPPSFEMLFPPRAGVDPNIEIWNAMRLNFDTAPRSTGSVRVIARLKPGATQAQAQAEADAVATTLREQWPSKKNVDMHYRVIGMHADLVRDVRALVLSLFGAVVFVLLIACANVANLLLVRASARQREFVIRSAIGGGRWRLVRQMLTETLLLAGLGGAIGVALGYAGVDLLAAMAPPGLPRAGAVKVDAIVLAFSVGATLVTALVCGIVPALRGSRQNVADIVRSTAPGLMAGKALRYGVVLTEVALSFVLLAGSGLMIRSFVALQQVDPGFDQHNLLTFFRPAQRPGFEQRAALMRQTAERLRAIPGVVSAAAANPAPLTGFVGNIPWAPKETGSVDPAAFRQADNFYVTPGYFDTMKIRLVAGRTFTEDDNTLERAQRVVVIDEMVAAQAYPDGSAIGKTLLVRNLWGGAPNAPTNVEMQVIGVVGHQRHATLAEAGREAIFFVDALNGFGSPRWVVRTTGDPSAIIPAVTAAMAEIDSRVPVTEALPMQWYVDKANGPTRFATTLIGIFAAIAVLLAGVGLYGVLSTTVRQRTAEIGMRMVCGAEPRGVLRLVLGEGLKLSLAGMAVGFVAALSMTGLIRSLLVSVTPTDPMTFVAITVLFIAIVTISSLIPALRAARVDPVTAIRQW